MGPQSDPGQGTPVHRPEQWKSAPPIMEPQPETYTPAPKFRHESWKHAHRHGSMSSSRSKKYTVLSISSGQAGALHSKTHKSDKRTHCLPDPLVPVTDPHIPALSPLAFSESLVLGQVILQALVPSIDRVPLTPGRLATTPGPHELFALGEMQHLHALVFSSPKKRPSPVLDLSPSGHVHTTLPTLSGPSALLLMQDFGSSSESAVQNMTYGPPLPFREHDYQIVLMALWQYHPLPQPGSLGSTAATAGSTRMAVLKFVVPTFTFGTIPFNTGGLSCITNPSFTE